MNQTERQQLKALYVATALYFGQEIPDAALGLYVEDLDDLPFADVCEALKQLRRDSSVRKFPLPSEIREKLCPPVNTDDEAAIVANEIIHAISRCGPYNSPMLSKIAKQVVDREGGWTTLCEMVTYDNLPILKAQWRGLARGLLNREIREQFLSPGIEHRPTGELQKLNFSTLASMGASDAKTTSEHTKDDSTQ